jgi:putative lipoic acid-binding regulatory protein
MQVALKRVMNMQMNLQTGPGSRKMDVAPLTELYPAEVHFSVVVTGDFAGEAALAEVLAARRVTRPLRAGGISRSQKYRAFSVSVMIPSRDELERLDRELRAVQGVKLLL